MPQTGSELRFAREQAGLSAEMIAQRTKFKLYRIVALEEGDFYNLPHGPHLDAIVRAYANEVGIDPEPMVERVRAERGTRPGDGPIQRYEPVDFERRNVAVQVAETVEPSRGTIVFSALALLALLGWGSYLYEASGAAKRDIPGKMYAALTGQSHTQVTASQDVTGSWRLATQVESSKYSHYEGLLLGYELRLDQNGERVTGVGRKIAENGQTPIAISGVVDGDRLMLTFIEGGAQRTSRGAVVLQRQQDGTMRGRFTTNAAGSSGSAEARRVE